MANVHVMVLDPDWQLPIKVAVLGGHEELPVPLPLPLPLL